MGPIATAWKRRGAGQSHLIFLDVAFLEDQSRTRSGYGGENIAAIRKIANNALKQCTSRKGGVKAKRLQAGWDERFMAEILLTL